MALIKDLFGERKEQCAPDEKQTREEPQDAEYSTAEIPPERKYKYH